MNPTILAMCIIFGAAFVSPLMTAANARVNTNQKQPKQAKEMYVIVTAWLYEVDEAFYKKLAKAERLTRADFEEFEAQELGLKDKKLPAAHSLIAQVEKQKPLMAGKAINIDPGQEGIVLSLKKTIQCLPGPDQLHKGQQGPQTIHEGVSLRVQANISADRRYVRAKFIENSAELEGTEKFHAFLNGKEVAGEFAFVKEGIISQLRDIPDGGSFLLPLQYRPRTIRQNDRWLVALIVPQIYIEAEQRVIRGESQK